MTKTVLPAVAAERNESERKTYKVRFLVSTKSWNQVKKIFKDDLGITKNKEDSSVVPIRDHFVVEVELLSVELSDDFYKEVVNSKHITIISDEFSQESARRVLELVAGVELKLRELTVYAYDLAATYKQIMSTKHKDAKQLLSNNQLVGEDVADPLVSFLDFGELIDFLGKTGNRVDESNLADDTARLIESSASFNEFKKKYAQKFKKLTVWEIISRVVLAQETEWVAIKRDLDNLKDIRNTALHHRTLTPAKTSEAKTITARLIKHLKTKTPQKNSIERMDAVFESWNMALKGYSAYQKALDDLATIDASALRRMAERQFDSQKMLQQAREALGNASRSPNIRTSVFDPLSKASDSVNSLGLTSWITDNNHSNPNDKANRDDSSEDEEENYAPKSKEG